MVPRAREAIARWCPAAWEAIERRCPPLPAAPIGRGPTSGSSVAGGRARANLRVVIVGENNMNKPPDMDPAREPADFGPVLSAPFVPYEVPDAEYAGTPFAWPLEGHAFRFATFDDFCGAYLAPSHWLAREYRTVDLRAPSPPGSPSSASPYPDSPTARPCTGCFRGGPYPVLMVNGSPRRSRGSYGF